MENLKVKVKSGPQNCGSPDGAQGTGKKHRSPALECVAVQGSFAGPGKSGAPHVAKRTLDASTSFDIHMCPIPSRQIRTVG